MDSSFAYLFRELNEGQMKKIMAIGKETSMKKGQQIFREGQEANGVYVIREGSVELMTVVEKDFELPISILRNPGDVFGSSALVSSSPIQPFCALRGRRLAFLHGNESLEKACLGGS